LHITTMRWANGSASAPRWTTWSPSPGKAARCPDRHHMIRLLPIFLLLSRAYAPHLSGAHTMKRLFTAALAFAALSAPLAQAQAPNPSAGQPQPVTIYSSRIEQLIKPLLDRYTLETGVKVNLL